MPPISEFQAFARSAHLHRYLTVFNHTVEEREGQPFIRYQGKMEPWERVREVALAPPPELKNPLPKLYNPPWKYGKEGVQNRTFYDWTELAPFMRVDKHPWGAQYILELCCLCTGKFRCLGDHTWTRLKTPEGDVYSFGLYREDNDKSSAFELKAGRLQSPDVSEFWPETIHTLSFVISQESFCRIKDKVEEDHRGNGVVFHVVSRNCTAYALGVARLADINVRASMPCIDNFIPAWLPPAPPWFYRVSSLVFNVGQAVFGGTKVSKTLPQDKKPHIQSVLDLFRISTMESPYKLLCLSKESLVVQL